MAAIRNPQLIPLLFCAIAAAIATPPAGAADPKTTALNSQIAQQQRTIEALRKELEQARADTATRIETARSGLQAQLRERETQLDQAHAEAFAAHTLADSRQDQTRQLRAQLEEQTRSRAQSETQTARLAETTKTAVQTAVALAARRHSEDKTQLSTTAQSADSAAMSARAAADLGQSNAQALKLTDVKITKQAAALVDLKKQDTKARRLLVLVACGVSALVLLLFVNRRPRPSNEPGKEARPPA
jgi:chromosome segregation ATPase